LFVLAIVVFSFLYYYKKQKEKQRRFLQIIQDLKAHKNSEIHKSEISVSAFEVQSKQNLDDELIEKLTLGLKKLEQKELS
jgi:hypothetical protein